MLQSNLFNHNHINKCAQRYDEHIGTPSGLWVRRQASDEKASGLSKTYIRCHKDKYTFMLYFLLSAPQTVPLLPQSSEKWRLCPTAIVLLPKPNWATKIKNPCTGFRNLWLQFTLWIYTSICTVIPTLVYTLCTRWTEFCLGSDTRLGDLTPSRYVHEALILVVRILNQTSTWDSFQLTFSRNIHITMQRNISRLLGFLWHLIMLQYDMSDRRSQWQIWKLYKLRLPYLRLKLVRYSF